MATTPQRLSTSKQERENASTPLRWTFRGAGSDHEILVRLRESTPISEANGENGGTDGSESSEKSSTVGAPDRLLCSQCKRTKFTKDFWWCRTCQKTLCSNCNLVQGHTEHRTAPWRPEELVRSLVDTVEARCTARTVRSAEEEAAIKEYMREIENYFLSKLHNRLDERNKDDRELMKAISSSTGVSFTNRKRWPSATPPAPVTSNGTATNLAQFSGLLTDDSLARLVQEIGCRLLPENSNKLVITKLPRTLAMLSPPSDSPASSPLLNGRAIENASNDEEELRVLTQHFYSFAAILPNVEPLEFAQLLEQQREFSPRIRSRSHSAIPPRGVTPTMERVHSRAQSPGPSAVNGTMTPLSIYGATNIGGDAKRQPITNGSSQMSPSTYSISGSEFVRNDYSRRTIPTSTPSAASALTDRPDPAAKTLSAVSNDSSPPAPPISTSTNAQSGPTPRRSLPKAQPAPIESKRRFSLPSRHKSAKSYSPPLADAADGSKVDASSNRQRQLSTSNDTPSPTTSSVSLIAFHFGEDFLTRPIDVQAINGNLMAVSDSCGGVYITDASGGKILRKIWLDGNSASSLCYVPSLGNQPGGPPLLLVSVLGKSDRSVRFYETDGFSLVDNIQCPMQPDIDMGRSRWLAADDDGSVYLISGDGKTSALWKLHSLSDRPWTLLKQSSSTRYQYLNVVQRMADSNSVTLLTTEGVHGRLLLITVSRSAGKILAEQDFTDSYGLDQYIRSPASAVVDNRGNMLILDYYNGKLWLLKAPRGSRHGGDRRLKLLTEFGSQQAMGICAAVPFCQSDQPNNAEQWCYVACFNKRRVHAVKYLSD